MLVNTLLAKVIGTQNERDLKKLRPIIAEINAKEPAIQALSDAQLREKTEEFRHRLAQGQTIDDILPEAFAVVREAGRRVLNMRHFDVQLIGGIVLHRGRISEMKTGEGKTLVATLPAYLNALDGKGVHVVTVNDYLARRDSEWMGRLYRFLGLSVGVIQHELNDQERQVAYGSDITYGTNNEFGFDYLRDNMKFELAQYVQRGHHFAIVDEVDSISAPRRVRIASQYMAFCDVEGRYQLRLPSDLGLVDLHPHADAYRTADPSFEPTETFHRIVSEEPGPMQVDFTFRRLPESPVRRTDKSQPAPPTTRRIVYAAWEKLNLAGIKGKVLDEHGKPVVRARLYVIDLTTPYESDPRSPSEKKPVARPLTSNFAGAFEYPYIDSDQPLWIIAWDQAGERVAQITTTPGTREVEVRLSQRGAKITGTIRDEAGKPVEGIPVHLTHRANIKLISVSRSCAA